jgi:hypothetical protein
MAIIKHQSTGTWCVNEAEAIPVTGREGSYDCETSRFSHSLDNRHRDGGEVVSLTRRPPITL